MQKHQFSADVVRICVWRKSGTWNVPLLQILHFGKTSWVWCQMYDKMNWPVPLRMLAITRGDIWFAISNITFPRYSIDIVRSRVDNEAYKMYTPLYFCIYAPWKAIMQNTLYWWSITCRITSHELSFSVIVNTILYRLQTVHFCELPLTNMFAHWIKYHRNCLSEIQFTEANIVRPQLTINHYLLKHELSIQSVKQNWFNAPENNVCKMADLLSRGRLVN